MGIVAHGRVACILLLSVHTRQAKQQRLFDLLVCPFGESAIAATAPVRSGCRLQTKQELFRADVIHSLSDAPGLWPGSRPGVMPESVRNVHCHNIN